MSVATYEPVVVGFDFANQRAARVPVPGYRGAHHLYGGASGSGKSQVIHAVLAQLAPRPHIALAVSDPALVDYMDWAPRVSSMALGIEGAAWLLEQAEREMIRRLKVMRKMGEQKLEAEHLSSELPHLIYVFDELAMVMLSKVPGAEARLVKCAQVFRKTAQGLLLATQHPKATVCPTMLRGQCAVRLCLRTKEAEATESVLDTRRYPAHELPFDLPGVGFVELPSGEVVKIRVPLVGQSEVRRIAAETASLTPVLPADAGWRSLFDPYEEGDAA